MISWAGSSKHRDRSADVLITQGAGKIAYNVVRSLGRHGLEIVVGVDKFSGMAVFSRYATERVHLPFLTTQTAAFVKALKEVLQRYSPKVYMPMGDDTYVAAKHIDAFQETGVIVPIAPFEAIERLVKKDEVASLAQCLGIPCLLYTSPSPRDS